MTCPAYAIRCLREKLVVCVSGQPHHWEEVRMAASAMTGMGKKKRIFKRG